MRWLKTGFLVGMMALLSFSAQAKEALRDYKSKAIGISVRVPETWVAKEEKVGPNPMVMFYFPKEADNPITDNLSIMRIEKKGSLEEYLFALSEFNQQILPGFKQLARSETKLHGKPAIHLVCESYYNEHHLSFLAWYLEDEKNVYNVTFTTGFKDDTADIAKTLEKILQSLRLS